MRFVPAVLSILALSSTVGCSHYGVWAARPGEATSAPAPAPAAKKSRVTITTDRLEFEGVVLFETGSATLAASSNEVLDDVAATAIEHTEIKALHVIGHTDNTGDHDANVALSMQRATTVVEYLRAKGVTQVIDARGAGPDEPLCTEATEDCNAMNRRVEFKIER
jgi:outer membrane protein OmpA-like peptidoglycan-associated protein